MDSLSLPSGTVSQSPNTASGQPFGIITGRIGNGLGQVRVVRNTSELRAGISALTSSSQIRGSLPTSIRVAIRLPSPSTPQRSTSNMYPYNTREQSEQAGSANSANASLTSLLERLRRYRDLSERGIPYSTTRPGGSLAYTSIVGAGRSTVGLTVRTAPNTDVATLIPAFTEIAAPPTPLIPTEVSEIDANFDLEELLQCPVCFEMCQPPIFQCIQGHILCGDCHPKVGGVCPVCRQSVMPNMRNRPLEAVYNATKFACKYKDFGCGESVRGDKFKEHVDACSNKPFTCTFGNDRHKCSSSAMSISTLALHFVNDHHVPRYTSGQYCSHFEHLLPDSQIPLACWEFDGKSFIEAMLITPTHCYINILLIGSKTEAEKYVADMQLIKTGLDCAPNIRKSIISIRVLSIWHAPCELKAIFGCCVDLFQSKTARLDASSGKYCWMTRVDFKKLR